VYSKICSEHVFAFGSPGRVPNVKTTTESREDTTMSATITAFPLRTATPRADRTAESPSERRVVRTRLHITGRGRAVLTAIVLVPLLLLVGALVLNGGGANATGQVGSVHFQHVTVASGETLWQIAQDVAPTADPRDVIAAIVQLNNMQGASVQAGQSLAIPTKYSAK
jgi:LysM repeat protein